MPIESRVWWAKQLIPLAFERFQSGGNGKELSSGDQCWL